MAKNNAAANHVRSAFQNRSGVKMYRGTRASDELEAVGTKMVHGTETGNAIRDEDKAVTSLQDPFVQTALGRSIERIRDNSNILQLLPDIRLAIEVIIGGVLSPKDLQTTELTFSSDNEAFDQKSLPILKHIEKYFLSQYKLKDLLPKMLNDILAKTGSYPLAVLPETSVDYLINSNVRITMESMTQSIGAQNGKLPPVGLLGNKRGTEINHKEVNAFELFTAVSNESLGSTEYSTSFNSQVGDSDLYKLDITDNFDALKLPDLSRRISEQTTHNLIHKRRTTALKNSAGEVRCSVESMVAVHPDEHKRSVEEIDRLNKLYPKRQYNTTPVARVKPKSALERKTFGHPKVMKLPTEAVIPVYSPNDPSDHVGYFVALDHTGYPVRLIDLENIYRTLAVSANTGSNVTSQLLQSAANGMTAPMGMMSANNAMMAYERAVPIYTQMVESELLDRLERGTVGTGVSLGRVDSIYQIMLARAMMGKRTQLLYIPASLLSYMAIDYDEYGLGKTLLDDSKTLASLRSMQLFANSMAATKNAITHRILNVELDPQEKNPKKAEELILHEYAKSTHASYPITNNPVDQVNFLQLAGVQVRMGPHPRLPNTQITTEFLNNDYAQIDTQYDDWLKKAHTMSFGLPIDVIEGAGSADFATQSIFANVLTQRRIKGISDCFGVSISDFVRKYTYNSQILFDEIVGLIEQNELLFKNQLGEDMTHEEVATVFIESIKVSLPSPDTKSNSEQAEAFKDYRDFIGEALTMFIDQEFVSEVDLGEIANSDVVEKTKNFLKAHFTRDWMRENGIMPEMFKLLAENRDGTPMIDVLETRNDYYDALSKSLMPMMKAQMDRVRKNDEEINQYKEQTGGEVPGEGSTGGGGYDGGDNFGGGDDFGAGDDFGMGDENPEDTDTDAATEEPEAEDDENKDEGDGADENVPV